MNPVVREKLVMALRSGEFKQGRRALRSDDCYCIMGVLCELYRREHTESAAWKGAAPQYFRVLDGNGSIMVSAEPPFSVRQWAGLAESEMDWLVIKNDVGTSFAVLADYIEAML